MLTSITCKLSVLENNSQSPLKSRFVVVTSTLPTAKSPVLIYLRYKKNPSDPFDSNRDLPVSSKRNSCPEKVFFENI